MLLWLQSREGTNGTTLEVAPELMEARHPGPILAEVQDRGEDQDQDLALGVVEAFSKLP